MKNLLTTTDLTEEEIYQIFELARFYIKNGIKPDLNGKMVFSFFAESSTRTEISFSVAAKKLGCIVEKINPQNLATKKGESFVDLITTLDQMAPDLLVARHNKSGVMELIKKYINCSIINAGDGTNQHPTQALIDAFTILNHKEQISGVNVLICGDILNSRVAHSDIEILTRLGANVSITGPSLLMTKYCKDNIKIYKNFEDAIPNADVILMLRMQKERHKSYAPENPEQFKKYFCLDTQRLDRAKKDVIIMHPGPVNRNTEISDEVLKNKNCVITKQANYAKFIRAGVINFLLG